MAESGIEQKQNENRVWFQPGKRSGKGMTFSESGIVSALDVLKSKALEG